MTIHTLAETQTAGFGMANGKVVQRLVVAFDEDRPAVTVRLERINHPDPLDDRDPTERTLTELSVKPTDDVDEKVEIGTRHGQDRVRLASHDHAPRVYVRHERQDGGWSEQTAWELHPTTGITQVGGEVVADGGSESGTCESDISHLDVMAPLVIAVFYLMVLAFRPPIHLRGVLYGVIIGLSIGWACLRYDRYVGTGSGQNGDDL